MKRACVVALYLRVSVEDEGLGPQDESGSIAGQRLLLEAFVRAHRELAGCRVMEVVDEGYSGTGFERPGLRRPLELPGRGEIQCVVVKVFSRLGRDYVQVGDYLEQVFPSLGVRFLSVNDHFDSSQGVGAAGSIDVGFKNLVYEAYSRDLSVKVKSARRARAGQGKFVTAFAPYGYVKDERDGNRLRADRECADVVRRIFQARLYGAGPTQIAGALNEEKILSPLMLRRKRREHFPAGRRAGVCLWTASTICRILDDYRYTGAAVYGKVKSVSVGSKRCVEAGEEEWVVVPGAHEALISQEMFEQVQAKRGRAGRGKRSYCNRRGKEIK